MDDRHSNVGNRFHKRASVLLTSVNEGVGALGPGLHAGARSPAKNYGLHTQSVMSA